MGGGNSVLIEIVIFAMIAVFLVYRLRSVLGRRTGEERERPNPYAPAPGRTDRGTARDNVIPLPGRGEPVAQREAPDEPKSLAAHLASIGEADPSFDEKAFVHGARQAFSMIVGAFASGDTAALRPLLDDAVYDNFTQAIRRRAADGETLETVVEAIREADIVDARLDGRTAKVTVRFLSRQSNILRDRAGQILDGDPNHPVEAVDIWTFARNTRSQDPNWLLVETRTAG